MPSIRLKPDPDHTTLATLNGVAEGSFPQVKAEEEETLKLDDAFIVCDNLISYEVQQLDPLRFKERSIGDGSLCTSMLLDPSFKECIEAIIGEADRNSLKTHGRKKTKEFEYGIKRTRNERDDHIYSVDLQGFKDDCKTSVVDYTISVTM
ncbi:MAG: hypothetical protein Q9221_004633 [Calogaya cf. arnoldii]